jgi:hypothetical protein
MNSLALNLLIFVGSVALAGFVSLKAFRFYIRSLGMEKVMAEGILLGETGIEFPRTLFLGLGKIEYHEIESVELVHFPATMGLRFRYGKALSSRPGPSWREFIQDTVVIKIKPPRLIEYEAFTPKNPAEFYKELKARLERSSKIETTIT